MTATPALTVPTVMIEGNLARVEFGRFDLAAYERFLACKTLPESRVTYDWRTDSYTLTTPARFADRLGAGALLARPSLLPCPDHPFDYQRWIVFDLALPARRFAAWIDTGLGKMVVILEWCRQVLHLTGSKVLILEPSGVIQQMIDEAARWYGDDLPLRRLETRAALVSWLTATGCELGITNDEKLIEGEIPEMRHLGGLAYDESSRLKAGGGTIKWNVIHPAKGIEFKLSATATPAPNDVMEYASQASFLEMMRSEGEIFWTYFTRNPRTDAWEVKPHARSAFYAFMASWSVYMRNPAHFGFADVLAGLPDPEIREYELPLHPVQRELMHGLLGPKGGMFNDDRLTLAERSKLSQLAAGFLFDGSGGKRRAVRYPSEKPGWVADRVAARVRSGRPTIVWTVFDEEGEIVAEGLPSSVRHAILSGKQTDAQRAEILRLFREGELDAVISKPSLIGYGLNLQFVRAMVFSGFDDSFERIYQSIRRAYRLGQTETVHVDFPHIPELQGTMFSNIKRKQRQFDEDTAIQEAHYRRVLMGGAA